MIDTTGFGQPGMKVQARLAPSIPLGRQAFGNKEVLEHARKLIREIKKGDISWMAVCTVGPGQQANYGFCGVTSSQFYGIKGLKILLSHIEETERKAHAPPDPKSDFSYAGYDLDTYPRNFDFLIWLINSEMIRRRNNGAWPLRVGFANQHKVPQEHHRWVEDVARQLIPLVGAVEDADAAHSRHGAQFTPSDICAAFRRGEEIPMLSADEDSLNKMDLWLRQWGYPERKPVTITLREAPHYSFRNSNVEAFRKFARDLWKKDELVIFVRDTCKANEPLDEWITYPSASLAMQVRMALYQRAKCNLFTSNGPFGLGLFSKTDYMCFLKLQTDRGYEPNNPEWWTFANGISEGGNWPWATPGQHMIWGGDDYNSLSAAWERFRG